MAAPKFTIVRTDVTADSGEQRIFGCYESEDDAVAIGNVLTAGRYGEFAVAAIGPVTMRFVREGGVTAVRAVEAE